jgi:hypothetical protein
VCILIFSACAKTPAADPPASPAATPTLAPTPDEPEPTAEDDPKGALAFDADGFNVLSVTVGGQTTEVREYSNVRYVAAPFKMNLVAGLFGPPPTDPYGHQSMNIYIPESAYDDQNTAIYFIVNNAGWMASPVAVSVEDGGVYDLDNDVGAALDAGYIVVNVGTRSRGITEEGTELSVGKAPAVVVDAKAAVRYLRLNDDIMPGSAERIIANGTSGGGGLVTALGASGNSPDYFPYLAEIGAAGIDETLNSSIRDDIFAVVGYCPISDLANADLGYEWLYNSTRVAGGENPQSADFKAYTSDPGWQSELLREASNELKDLYPAYLAGLGLKLEDGTALTADNMEATIIKWLENGIEKYLNEVGPIEDQFEYNAAPGGFPGAPPVEPDMRSLSWSKDCGLVIDNDAKTATITDFEKYKAYVATLTTLKAVPAFDGFEVNDNPDSVQNETNLFGPRDAAEWHFTQYGWEHDTGTANASKGAANSGNTWAEQLAAEPELAAQIKMLNPLEYIDTTADAAPYWYIRHGGRDRDTTFTVSVQLYYKLLSDGSILDVNYTLPFNTPHSGNYDVPEAFAWIASVLN